MAQIKVSPTFITHKRQYENKKYGGVIHVFSMSVEDPQGQILEGIFTTTSENQTKFKVGEKVTVELKTAQEDHETVTKFDKVTEQGSSSGGSKGGYSGGGSRKDPVKDRSIVANVSVLVAMRMLTKKEGAKDVVQNDLKVVTTMANKVYEYIMTKANGNTQQSITIQAQVKIASEFLFDFPHVETDTSGQILEAADKLIEWVNEKAKG